MGVSFFQTAPRDHYIRTSILFNTIALIILLVAFGLSFDSESGVSSVKLSTDYFSTDGQFAQVSATRIYAFTNSSVLCPPADVSTGLTSFTPSSAANVECDRFTQVSKLTLGMDGITWILLLVLYCAQRYATVTVSDERALLGIYFGLQLVPLTFHVLARVIFDAAAVRRAISFLKLVGVNGGNSALSDEDVGIHYGPVQSLHATVAALLTASLAFIALKFFQITLSRRIESVELVRECAARVRGDNPDVDHPPMRWMLDPRYHPLYDADELESVRQKLIESNPENEDEKMQKLRSELEQADKEWEEQQQELIREEEAYKQYSHRIRREERVENRVVVDDWERQQTVWEQRKETIAKHFEEAGFSMPKAATTATTTATSSSPTRTSLKKQDEENEDGDVKQD